jgi:hypothetical protein
MATMYRTRHFEDVKIEEFEIAKSSEKSVFYFKQNGSVDRELRYASYHTWHESKQDAITYLKNRLMSRIERLEDQILKAKESLLKLETL